jgi:hypothetical protein
MVPSGPTLMVWCCVALLGFLSLLPAQEMMRTGFPGEVKHFPSYAGSAAIAMAVRLFTINNPMPANTSRSSISCYGMQSRRSLRAMPPSIAIAEKLGSRASSLACCLIATATG